MGMMDEAIKQTVKNNGFKKTDIKKLVNLVTVSIHVSLLPSSGNQRAYLEACINV